MQSTSVASCDIHRPGGKGAWQVQLPLRWQLTYSSGPYHDCAEAEAEAEEQVTRELSRLL